MAAARNVVPWELQKIALFEFGSLAWCLTRIGMS